MHGGAEAGGVHVVVVGATGRDLVLRGDEFPDAGSTVQVSQRIERLGGKGANQAVGLRQLHARHPASRIELVSVVGVDAAGDLILDEARDDGIGVDGIARRGETSLFVDVVAPDGDSRVFEHIPGESLLRQDDIAAAAELFIGADAVVLQLQQPAEALLAAAVLAVEQGALVVLDGAIAADAHDELLAFADVVRSDAHEAEVLTGRRGRTRLGGVRAVVDTTDLVAARSAVQATSVADPIAHYVIDLLEATRRHPRVSLGASTRGGVAVVGLAKAWAAIDGRRYVVPDDVFAVAEAGLAHRLVVPGGNLAVGREVVAECLAGVPAPAL